MAKAMGGARANAGRPANSGKFGCKTRVVRVPADLVDEVLAFIWRRLAQGERRQRQRGVEPGRSVSAPNSEPSCLASSLAPKRPV